MRPISPSGDSPGSIDPPDSTGNLAESEVRAGALDAADRSVVHRCQRCRTKKRVVPRGGSASVRSVSVNPSLAGTRREAVFQSQDRSPDAFVPGRSGPVQNGQRGLSCVSLAPRPTQQLERQLRFPIRSSSPDDQSAVADNITSGLPLDRQQPDRRRWPAGAQRLLELCTVGCPSTSMRQWGGTRGSRSSHSSRWRAASATRHGLRISRSPSSKTSPSGAPPPAMPAVSQG